MCSSAGANACQAHWEDLHYNTQTSSSATWSIHPFTHNAITATTTTPPSSHSLRTCSFLPSSARWRTLCKAAVGFPNSS